jgi:GT2 family glycosyltransferase
MEAEIRAIRTPVVILAFNRPASLKRLIKVLETYRPPELFLVCDGARESKPGEIETVQNVREILKVVTWDCKVHRNYSDKNMGCMERVSSGITWAFEHVDRAIILEEDCIPGPDFFRFCEELLDKYESDESIGSICGTNYIGSPDSCRDSYYFSRYHLFWGWATWKRAWVNFDKEMMVVRDGKLKGLLKKKFRKLRERLYWNWIMGLVYEGKMNSWGYRWMLSCWNHDLKGIFSARNLVTNVGFDEDAVHCEGRKDDYEFALVKLEDPLLHPNSADVSAHLDQMMEDRHFSKTIRQRILWLLKKIRKAK